MQELLDNVDEELAEYQSLGEFDEKTNDRLRTAFLPDRISDTLNIEGIHVNPRITLAVLEGLALADDDKYAEREIQNIIDAHDLLMELKEQGKRIVPGVIKQIAFQVTKDLIETAGSFRSRDVTISGAQVKPPVWTDVPNRMSELCAGLATMQAVHPIVRAAWLHREFAEIHPFDDGNGRTARLLQDLEMVQAGYLPVGIPAFRRREYYDALEQADFGDLEPLIAMIANSEQTALAKAGRIVRRSPDRVKAVQRILQGRQLARVRQEEQSFELWRRRVDLLRSEAISWADSFQAQTSSSPIRVKTWDPISFETWQEIKTRGWSRDSWLFTIFVGNPGELAFSVLFLVRRLDKIAALVSTAPSTRLSDSVVLQVAVSGPDGRYEYSKQRDPYITLRAIGVADHSFVAFDQGGNMQSDHVDEAVRTEHEIFERFFSQVALKAGWGY